MGLLQLHVSHTNLYTAVYHSNILQVNQRCMALKKLSEKVSLQSARESRLAAINIEECEDVKSLPM